MHFCCIVVAKEGKKIVIRFDLCAFNNQPRRESKRILDILAENVFYSQEKEVHDILNRTCNTYEFCLTYHQQKFNAVGSSGVYTLPTDPSMAVDLINCIDSFVRHHEFNHVQVADKSFLHSLQKKSSEHFVLAGLEGLINKGAVNFSKTSVAKQVVKAILALTDVKNYIEVKAALSRYLNNQLPPMLEVDNGKLKACRYYVMRPTAQQFLIIQQLIFKHIKDKKVAFAQLNEIIVDGNAWVKNKWLSQCIGKEAYAGLYYGPEYSELELLAECEYVLQSDGRICAVISETTVFAQLYAKGKKYHNQLQKELEHLASTLGLEFSSDTDFYHKLIFTPASSKQLMDIGLHLNVAYMKKYIFCKNSYQTLFGKSGFGVGKFQELPFELIDKISIDVADNAFEKLNSFDRACIRQIP